MTVFATTEIIRRDSPRNRFDDRARVGGGGGGFDRDRRPGDGGDRYNAPQRRDGSLALRCFV
jgi:hypothetical protein